MSSVCTTINLKNRANTPSQHPGYKKLVFGVTLFRYLIEHRVKDKTQTQISEIIGDIDELEFIQGILQNDWDLRMLKVSVWGLIYTGLTNTLKTTYHDSSFLVIPLGLNGNIALVCTDRLMVTVFTIRHPGVLVNRTTNYTRYVHGPSTYTSPIIGNLMPGQYVTVQTQSISTGYTRCRNRQTWLADLRNCIDARRWDICVSRLIYSIINNSIPDLTRTPTPNSAVWISVHDVLVEFLSLIHI